MSRGITCDHRLAEAPRHRGISRDSDALDPNAEIGAQEAQANGWRGKLSFRLSDTHVISVRRRGTLPL